MKYAPFLAKKPKAVIVPVGSPEMGGVIYLEKRGKASLTPNENPVDDQALERKQRKLAIKLEARAKIMAREKEISVAEARKKLFGSNTKSADPENQTEVDSNETEETMFDFLSEDEQTMVFDLQEDQRSLAIRSATRMIQYRAAIPVIVREKAQAGVRAIKVESTTCLLGKGDLIRFNDYTVAVRNFASIGSEVVEVEDTSFPLNEGEVGFLCDRDTARIKVGFGEASELDPEKGWSEKDTKDNISEQLIVEIVNFYRYEAGIDVDDIKELEGEVEIDEEGESPSLTGEPYITVSSTSDAETPVLTT